MSILQIDDRVILVSYTSSKSSNLGSFGIKIVSCILHFFSSPSQMQSFQLPFQRSSCCTTVLSLPVPACLDIILSLCCLDVLLLNVRGAPLSVWSGPYLLQLRFRASKLFFIQSATTAFGLHNQVFGAVSSRSSKSHLLQQHEWCHLIQFLWPFFVPHQRSCIWTCQKNFFSISSCFTRVSHCTHCSRSFQFFCSSISSS